MNKQLSTNSEALNNFLFDGTNRKEDKPIYITIENLKRASLSCCELGVTVEYEDANQTRAKLEGINRTITETWLTLSELLRDFAEQPENMRTA